MPLNVQCKRCANMHNDWCDKKHDSPDLDMVRDCQYYRTLTNYDRIIYKSPEELAKWIAGGVLNLTGGSLEMATEAWADWLKQEATDGT